MGHRVDLHVKEGLHSIEALALIDRDDLAQTKIARGQQKLLLSAIRLLKRLHETTAQSNMAADTAATRGDGAARSTAADGQTAGTGRRPNVGGDGQAIAAGILTTGADGQASTADGQAARVNGLPTGASGQPADIYARLMADHMEAMQGSATAGVDLGTWPHGTAGHVPTVGQSGTLQGSWQDPPIHLMTAGAGRSCHYHDVVDHIGKDVVEGRWLRAPMREAILS